MKWTMRYAALLAALVLALSLVGMLRPGVATANEDVEFLQPPSDKGDPDTGGGTFVTAFGWRLFISPARGPFAYLRVSLVRCSVPSRLRPPDPSRQVRAARR